MKKLIKKNYKFILGMIIGLIWSSGIAYAATILFDSDEVSYDNTTSGLSATNVQSALDELYVESTSYQLFESRVSSIENKLYPVGSYYETSDSSFNPNTSFGGTWALSSSGYFETKTVIWENANRSPVGSFNIPLNLSSYDELEVYQRGSKYATPLVRIEASVHSDEINVTYPGYISGRKYSLSQTGLSFENGYFYSLYSSANSKSYGDAYGLPIKVYGINKNSRYIWHRTA